MPQGSGIKVNSQFDLGISRPIDTRMEAFDTVERNGLLNKYAGMVVYVQNQDKHYKLKSGFDGSLDSHWTAEGNELHGTNGISINNSGIELGGELFKNTIIGGGKKDLTIGSSSNPLTNFNITSRQLSFNATNVDGWSGGMYFQSSNSIDMQAYQSPISLWTDDYIYIETLTDYGTLWLANSYKVDNPNSTFDWTYRTYIDIKQRNIVFESSKSNSSGAPNPYAGAVFGTSGFAYNADYSAQWNERSIVDKGYIDGKISGGTTSKGNNVLEASDVTVDGGANNSPSFIFRSKYDSDATTGIASTKKDFSIRNSIDVTGNYQLDFLNDTSTVIASLKSDGMFTGKTNATNITEGTLADVRLSDNIPRTNVPAVFENTLTISRSVSTYNAFNTFVTGESRNRFSIDTAGKHSWGSGSANG